MTKKQKKRKTSDAGRATKKAPAAHERGKNRQSKRRRRRLISPLRLRRLAFACEDLAEADQALALRRPLVDVIAGDGELAAAWRRGQFLRKLETAASKVQSLSQAAKWLKVAGGGMALRKILDGDLEAKDVWDENWLRAEMEVKAATFANAKAGNGQAIKTVENWIRAADGEAGATVRADYGRLSISQAAELFGVTRQAVHEWFTKQGLGRNPDGSFDLKTMIAWFEQFTVTKASRGKDILAEINPLQAIKARRLAVDLERARGNLLDREQVVAGQVARFGNLIDSLGKLAREVAPMLVNQTLDTIKEILAKYAAGVIVAQRQIPEELELPEAAAEALAKVYEELTTNEHE